MDWNDFFNKIAVMLASGTAPDVWYAEAGRALGWRYNGATADLTPYVERDLNLDHYFFLHAAAIPARANGRAFPLTFRSRLFYNINHFAERGIPFPRR